jgi:hypothetical protein
MKTTVRSFFAVAAVAALALAGCSSEGSAPEDEVVTSGEGETAEAIVDNATVAALTGEAIEAGSLSRPSLSAKIDNHPSARPQVGLDEADIVFEELVEGGLTRYVAVWHSTLPAEIGPVRSVRPMDPEIVSPFGGVFAYSGGQVRFIQMMQEAPVYNAIHGQPDTEETFYRTSAKVAPHNVLVKAPELIDQHLDLPAPVETVLLCTQRGRVHRCGCWFSHDVDQPSLQWILQPHLGVGWNSGNLPALPDERRC